MSGSVGAADGGGGRRRAARGVSDRAMVGLAAAAALGAWVPIPIPVWPSAVAALLAWIGRRPALLVGAVAVLASALSAQAWIGVRPVASGPWSGRATLVTDPDVLGGAQHAEVRAHGHHFDVWARGRAGAVLSGRSAGQDIAIEGHVAPRARDDDWAARRHVVGRIEATEIAAAGDGDPVHRLANAVRAMLLRGAAVLAPDRRALFSGFVLGDDRGQSVVVADDFRGAGLTHLLVVSGENVAFVLAVAMPVLRRLGLRWRWAATLAVIGLFGVMTRFEPSVLRASVMASVAVTAWMLGRPVTGLRTLALAVTALVLADPMLVGVFGFQLSVAASGGILLLAEPLARHLPVPRLVAEPLGVTLAAQVAVGPLLAGRAGGLPVAGIGANLLAEPAAALIMAWGLTGGLLAGLIGAPIAGALHLPTSALLWWVEWVARRAAAAPLGQAGPATLAAAATAAVAAVGASRRSHPGVARVAWGAMLVVLLLPAALALQAPPLRSELVDVGTLWRSPSSSGAVLELASGARPAAVLDGLRRAGIGHLDLVLAASGGSSVEALVTAIRPRVTVDQVWLSTPTTDRSGRDASVASIVGERRPGVGEQLAVGSLLVTVTRAAPTLEVVVARPPGSGAGGHRHRSGPIGAAGGAGGRCRFPSCTSRSGPTAST